MTSPAVRPNTVRAMALLGPPPSRTDVALAGVLGAYALLEGILLGSPAPLVAAGVLAGLLLAWRRRHPVPVLSLSLVLVLLPGLLDFESFGSVLPLPIIIVSAYTAGREASSGAVATVGAIAVGALVAIAQEFAPPGDNSTAEDYVAILVIVGGPAAAGHVMRVREAENRHLEALTVQLAQERDRHARAAVIEERGRVARELHDIVAHSVSLIAVQSGAARELIGRDDARARESLAAVQQTARGALGEMRRLLTVLHADEDTPGLAPQPGLADVPALVEQARGVGLPVDLCEEGVRPQVSAGVDLSAFRIVQEALTNVRKHAGAVPTEVLVRYGDGEVLVEVANEIGDAARAGMDARDDGGHGIPGMRERARLYGGTLEVDRRDGRHAVRARLPLGDPGA